MALPAPGVLEVRSADAEHVIAVYHPLVLARFSRPPGDGELGMLRALADEGRTQGVKGGMLFVVARKNAAGGIEPRVRAFFEEMVRKHSGQFGASAVVVLMQGFGASLMRSFLTSLLLLTNKRKQLQIFGNVDEACRWLAPQHGMQVEALQKAYQEATVKIGA